MRKAKSIKFLVAHDKKTKQKHFIANYDMLTGLLNRASLLNKTTQALAYAKKKNNVVAILFMDLDGFKHVNDQAGHKVGDILLQIVATRLLSITRHTDIVARFGGDEFVLVLKSIKDKKNTCQLECQPVYQQ